MSKNMYIKNICGTNSDPDDLWVLETPSNFSSADIEILKTLKFISKGDYIGVVLESNNSDDTDIISFYDFINDPTIYINKYNIDCTDKYIMLMEFIRNMLEDEISENNIKFVRGFILMHKFINDIIINCRVYPSSEFYFE